MLQDALKIMEQEVELIRLDYIETPLAHETLDLLMDRVRLRIKEECLPPLMSPEHADQESARCFECNHSNQQFRCVKHRKE